MTSLIMIIAATVSMASVTWFLVRRRATRLDQEGADDAAIRDLYDHYRSGIDLLTQAHLARAPSDEQWLARIRARADRATPDVRWRTEEELLLSLLADGCLAEMIAEEGRWRRVELHRLRKDERIPADWWIPAEPCGVPSWFSWPGVVGALIAGIGLGAVVIYVLIHASGQVVLAFAMPAAATLLTGCAAIAVSRLHGDQPESGEQESIKVRRDLR